MMPMSLKFSDHQPSKTVFWLLVLFFSCYTPGLWAQQVNADKMLQQIGRLGRGEWYSTIAAHTTQFSTLKGSDIDWEDPVLGGTFWINYVAGSPDAAYQDIIAMAAKQQADGAMPTRMNSPLWVLAVEDYIKVSGNLDASNALYPALVKYVAWYDKNFQTIVAEEYGQQNKRVFLTSMAYLIYDCARKWSLRAKEDPTPYLAKTQALKAKIAASLFDPTIKAYSSDGKLNLDLVWPMVVTGAATIEHVRHNVAHLLDPKEFLTEHPAPFLPKQPTSNNIQAYWAARAAWNQGRSNAGLLILKRALDQTAKYLGTDETSIYLKYQANGKSPAQLPGQKKGEMLHNPIAAMVYLYQYMVDNKME